MNTYTTTEAAKIIGIHPNTVRMYEEWGLIPRAERKPNGYRVFTDFHIEQLNAEEAISIAKQILSGKSAEPALYLKRKEGMDYDWQWYRSFFSCCLLRHF